MAEGSRPSCPVEGRGPSSMSSARRAFPRRSAGMSAGSGRWACPSVRHVAVDCRANTANLFRTSGKITQNQSEQLISLANGNRPRRLCFPTCSAVTIAAGLFAQGIENASTGIKEAPIVSFKILTGETIPDPLASSTAVPNSGKAANPTVTITCTLTIDNPHHSGHVPGRHAAVSSPPAGLRPPARLPASQKPPAAQRTAWRKGRRSITWQR